MVYYIKQDENLRFRKVKIEDNICKIVIKSDNNTVKKIVKKIKKNKIDKVVLSRRVKENQEIIKELKNYNITILDGKRLMQYMINEIIFYLEEHKKINYSDEIAILSNNANNEIKRVINELFDKYKKVRIVTNNLKTFKKMENELLDYYGIPVIVSNNKRKALSKSSLIINFDFNQENINEYNINEKAIIINMNEEIKIGKKRFNGFVICDYEIELDREKLFDIKETQIEFSLKDILEEKIYNRIEKTKEYNRVNEVRDIIEKYNIHICELIGRNGSLN